MLTKKEIDQIQERMAVLEAEGVKTTETLSGELNMSGCASSSCMAWA